MAQASKKKSTASNIGPAGKALIVLFAVLMALSLMLPSLSAIFSGSSGSSTSSDQTTSDTSDSDTSDDSTEETDYVAKADEKYGSAVTSLEEKYSSDPTNLATLLNLGKNYMTWGTYVRYFGSTDENTSHANELLSKAVTYYDAYLAIKDSSAVRVDKALCAYYQEEYDSALEQLESLTASAPDYGPGWANLGMLYEASGDDDAAKAAYAKAEETDPNDEYGAKSYAQNRLASLESSDEEDSSSSTDSSTATTSADSGDTSSNSGSGSTSVEGLSDTLSDLTGTSL